MDFDRHAPKNLEKLFGMMKSHVSQDQQRRIKLSSAKKNPELQCFCPICTAVHAKETILEGDTRMKSKVCPECQAHLDNGGIAIKCKTDTRHCFIWSDGLVGQGPIIEVLAQEFEAIMALNEQKQKEKEDGQT